MFNIRDAKDCVCCNRLVESAEKLTDIYIKNTCSEYRKSKGQFFTPKSISEFMVRQFDEIDKKDEVRILDPGAGIGIFESAICDLIISKGKKIKLSFDIYENDENILPYLKTNMRNCQRKMIREGFDFSYKIYKDDFITKNSTLLSNNTNGIELEGGYDLAISNPPYFKIKRNGLHVRKTERILDGPPNIYVAFMAISAKLLRAGGKLIVLTPRSYCSGLYFSKFRNWFFNNLKPIKVHVFDSRKEVFKRYDVLQEMIILTAIKGKRDPKYILITKTRGEIIKGQEIYKRKTRYANCIIKSDKDIIMRIPTSASDELLVKKIDKQGFKLDSLGLKISTGPVVPFRASNFLIKSLRYDKNYVPLIWMQNIRKGRVVWPIDISNKPTAIRRNEKTKKILVPNKNYVLIKRFSAKEGKRRIDAGVILKKWIYSDLIGIENHVNYISKINGNLCENEAHGLAAIFNSNIYDKFFQIMNGSTQVNATEIMNIPLPNIDKIRKIGKLVKKSGGYLSDNQIIRILNF